MSTGGDTRCCTRTLCFPPWFFQQVLSRSGCRMPGSAPNSADASASGCCQSQSSLRHNFKGQNSPSCRLAGRGCRLAEPGSGSTGFLTSCRLFSHSNLPPPRPAEQHQGPLPDKVTQSPEMLRVPQDTAPRGQPRSPTACTQARRVVPPQAESSLTHRREASRYQLRGDIYHNI